jgi:hypothetical protein
MNKENRITPEQISTLQDNEIFVFGSNLQGEHVGGAALFALSQFGAIEGQGEGLQGHSYAIPSCVRLTKDRIIRFTRPFAKASEMKPYIDRFIEFAKQHGELHFLVTKIGCGIAGMPINEVAELFKGCVELDNVSLPIEFWSYYMIETE